MRSTDGRRALDGRVVTAALAAVVLAVVVAVLGSGLAPVAADDQAAPVARRAPVTMLVVGDSITAQGNDDPRSGRQGWWSKLASRLGVDVVVSAQGGSGFVKQGERHPHAATKRRCDGTTFGQRLARRGLRRAMASADVVVVEGGKNDFHTCIGHHVVRTTLREVLAAADDYFDLVASIRTGQDPGTVYVLTPWADHTDRLDRRRVVPLVRRAAEDHGFRWVDTAGVLDPHHRGENTRDGIHPDDRGTTALAVAVITRSDIDTRVRALERGAG